MDKKHISLFLLLSVVVVFCPISFATAGSEIVYTEDSTCDDFSGGLYRLCNTYCNKKHCDRHPQRRCCRKLRHHFSRVTGSTLLPCDPRCGDGILDPDYEECDDGNNEACDGCSPDCMVEGCGDDIVCPPEECEFNEDCDSGRCMSNCMCHEFPRDYVD